MQELPGTEQFDGVFQAHPVVDENKGVLLVKLFGNISKADEIAFQNGDIDSLNFELLLFHGIIDDIRCGKYLIPSGSMGLKIRNLRGKGLNFLLFFWLFWRFKRSRVVVIFSRLTTVCRP